MTALPSTEDLARLAKENYDDPQYLAALGLMIVTGRTATSLVQRALGIGYNHAARIVERIEADGIISRPNNCGKREVLDRREAEAWRPETNILPWVALTIEQMRQFEASSCDLERLGLNGEWIPTDTPLSPGLVYRIKPTPTTEASHDR